MAKVDTDRSSAKHAHGNRIASGTGRQCQATNDAGVTLPPIDTHHQHKQQEAVLKKCKNRQGKYKKRQGGLEIDEDHDQIVDATAEMGGSKSERGP